MRDFISISGRYALDEPENSCRHPLASSAPLTNSTSVRSRIAAVKRRHGRPLFLFRRVVFQCTPPSDESIFGHFFSAGRLLRLSSLHYGHRFINFFFFWSKIRVDSRSVRVEAPQIEMKGSGHVIQKTGRVSCLIFILLCRQQTFG